MSERSFLSASSICPCYLSSLYSQQVNRENCASPYFHFSTSPFDSSPNKATAALRHVTHTHTRTHNPFRFSLLRGKSWRSPSQAVKLHLRAGLVWSPAPNESTADILSWTDLYWAIILLLLSNYKTWRCSLWPPSPMEIARLCSTTPRPPSMGAVSCSLLPVQPCIFLLLVTHMIRYVVGNASNLHEVRVSHCRVGLMTDQEDSCQDRVSLTFSFYYPCMISIFIIYSGNH